MGRSRFNEMMAKTDPPEPKCARCGAYILDEDMDENGENWKCSSCGYDGEPIYCDGCGKQIHPKLRCGLCDNCKMEEDKLQYEEFGDSFETNMEGE